jgi:hypothetical protein
VTAKLSKPVQGSLEAFREAALRQEDEKKREAQSAGAKKTLKKIAAAKAKKQKKGPEGDVEAPAPKKKQKNQPVEGPAPPARELQNVDSDKEGDEDYDPEQWTVTDHAIDNLDGEPKFKAVTGRREDGRDKTFWGNYENLSEDGVLGLDGYIRDHCRHPVFAKVIPKKKQKKEPREEVIKEQLPCNHAGYGNFKDEINPAYCKERYYLFGATCGKNCGTSFVARLTTEGEATGTAVPSTSAPVHCCLNIEDCKYAVCNACWSAGIVNQPRKSRNARN